LYRQALERDPERTEALSELARLQAAAGDPAAALESLESLALARTDARPAVALRPSLLMMARSVERRRRWRWSNPSWP